MSHHPPPVNIPTPPSSQVPEKLKRLRFDFKEPLRTTVQVCVGNNGTIFHAGSDPVFAGSSSRNKVKPSNVLSPFNLSELQVCLTDLPVRHQCPRVQTQFLRLRDQAEGNKRPVTRNGALRPSAHQSASGTSRPIAHHRGSVRMLRAAMSSLQLFESQILVLGQKRKKLHERNARVEGSNLSSS